MTKQIEIPDCYYPKDPILVCPSSSTPRHTLYLSNFDDQKFLRFSIKYLYLYKKSVGMEVLRSSLSRVLVDYYPLAGRLRPGAGEDGEKLELECNAEGAVMAEAYMDLTAQEFLECTRRPNRSWRKLLLRVEAQSFVDVPPLVIQVTNLSCGGMILCTAINHCVCDGIGTAQFLQAWAHSTAKPEASHLPVAPFHGRAMLMPRKPPPQATFSHPEFNAGAHQDHHHHHFNILTQFLLTQPLVPVCITFTPSQILHLKKQCVPSIKCTSFEALASHVWRSWVKSFDPPACSSVKLLFSMNVRRKLCPELPKGYYGNGFVLACAETAVDRMATSNLRCTVKLVQEAKERLTDGYLRSMVDLLEEKRIKPDLSSSLVISQWSKLGLEDLDFGGGGKPMHMGPLASEIYCLFLPVIGDLQATRMLVSVPQGVAERFEHYCLKGLLLDDECIAEEEDEEIIGGRDFC